MTEVFRVTGEALVEVVARAERAEAERDRLLRIAGHLCVDPDLVGRSCGECLPCHLWAAAQKMADRAAFDEKAAK